MCFEACWSSASWEIVHSELENCWHNKSVTLCFPLINVTFCEEILAPLLVLLWIGSNCASLETHQLLCLAVWFQFKPVLINLCRGRGGFHQGRALHGRGGAPRLQGFHQHLRVQKLAAPQGKLCLLSGVTCTYCTLFHEKQWQQQVLGTWDMWYKLFTHGISPWRVAVATGWIWASKPH